MADPKMKIISLDDVKGVLPFRAGINTFDAKLENIVNAVSGQIEDVLRRKLAKAERTETFGTLHTKIWGYDLTGTDSSGISRREMPQTFWLAGVGLDMTAPITVKYEDYGRFDTVEPLEAEQFIASDEDDRVTIFLGTEHRGRCRITYTAGYEQDEAGVLKGVPEPIRMAALVQSLHLWNRANPEAVSAAQDKVGDYKVGMPLVVKGGLIPDAIAYLLPYRRIGMR